MIAQEALQNALLGEYARLRGKNPAFSLRAFARRLGVNSGALSSIMNGRRRISIKYAYRLSQKLNLAPESGAPLEALLALESQSRRAPAERQTQTLEMKSDQFHAIADGIHFAILALMETADFRPDPDWMALRLCEPPTRVRHALRRLRRLGLVVVSRGKWRLSTGHLKTTDGIADAAVRRFHEERLDEAKTKLADVPIEDRDFFASTLAVCRSQMPAARALIRAFKKDMATILETGEKDEVYRLCIQLFPVTDVQKKDDDR